MIAAPAVSAAKKPESTFEIQSPIKGLGVLQDGIMGSGINIEMNGRAGWNEITVTAPEYTTRKLRFWLEPGKKKIINADLVKTKHEVAPASWKSTFKKFDPAKLEKKASICAWYQSKANDKLYCDRITYLDDIFYADDVLFKGMDLREYQKNGELNVFRSLLASIEKPESTPAIEDFYTKHATQMSAFQLLSLHSLLLGDCPRVNAVYTDALQSFDRVNSLRLHMAVCAEAQNNQKLRDEIVTAGLKNPDPSITYWAFQLQLPGDVTKANLMATQCAKVKTLDLRCQEALAMVAKMLGKPAKINTPDIEETTFKLFLEIEEKLPKGQQEALYLNVASALEEWPHAIENYLLMAWINSVFSKNLIHDYYNNRKTQVAAILADDTLDKTIESMEKSDQSQLLPPIYMRRLRFSPTDPNLWYRLIRALSKSKQCGQLLTAMERGKDYLPKFNASLLQMRGACEVDLGKTKEALITYGKVMEVNPKVWSSPYNLATIYERMGNKKEAYNFYKQTLDLNPPADLSETIKARVIQYHPK